MCKKRGRADQLEIHDSRASSPAWTSEASLARTPAPRGFAARLRVLAKPVSLAQIGELVRRLHLMMTNVSNPNCKNMLLA